MEVDNRVKESLVIAAAVLAILNNSIQIFERLLKALKWLKRKLERQLAKQKPTKVVKPGKRRRRK